MVASEQKPRPANVPEENIYENREVKDYMNSNSFMRLLESERIKEKIRKIKNSTSFI